MQLSSRFFHFSLIAACVLGFGACAQAGELDDDADDDVRSRDDLDAGGDAKPRTDASGSSSSGGASSSSSGGSSSGGSDAGPDAGPLTACQQALQGILFDVDESTAPEQGLDWKVGASDGFSTTDTSWPYQPWVYSTPTTNVIPTACAQGTCVGTSLTVKYAQCQRGWIATPEADLSACAGKNVVLEFDHAYDFFGIDGFKDGGIVEMTGNGADFASANWSLLDSDDLPGTVHPRGTLSASYQCNSPNSFYVDGKRGYVGTHATTTTASLPVPQSVLTEHARVRFVFASGVAYGTTDAAESRNHTAFGWRVDNVRFEEQ